MINCKFEREAGVSSVDDMKSESEGNELLVRVEWNKWEDRGILGIDGNKARTLSFAATAEGSVDLEFDRRPCLNTAYPAVDMRTTPFRYCMMDGDGCQWFAPPHASPLPHALPVLFPSSVLADTTLDPPSHPTSPSTPTPS